MTSTWLLLDCNYLAYRAHFGMPELTDNEGQSTSVLFGFLRDVAAFSQAHNTRNIAFCFDVGSPKRKSMFPGYKERHSKLTPYQHDTQTLIRKQIDALRLDILPKMGFKNIFWQDGYEADDLIAALVNDLALDEEAVMVSADQDLYQLLSLDKSILWNPRKKTPYTVNSLFEEYGVGPDDWVWVKAIAGCSSDNVPGVPGVGVKTAVKYMVNQLKLAKYRAIRTNWDLVLRNKQLVQLPLPGVKIPERQVDHISRKTWSSEVKHLGMPSLAGEFGS